MINSFDENLKRDIKINLSILLSCSHTLSNSLKSLIYLLELDNESQIIEIINDNQIILQNPISKTKN